MSLWQVDSNLSPLAIPLEPMTDPTTCMLTESMLFVAGSGTILLLLLDLEEAGIAGIAKASMMSSQLGRLWTQPTASRSSMLVVSDGGSLQVPLQSSIFALRTDHDRKHLVASAGTGSLLIWDLDNVGLARHIVHGQPPLQVGISSLVQRLAMPSVL